MNGIWKEIYEEKTSTTKEELEQMMGNLNKLSDESIIVKVGLFTPSQNCASAADGYLTIISQIGVLKPDLTEELLKIAIRPMYYAGASRYEYVKKWIESFMENKKEQLSEEQKNWLLKVSRNVELIAFSLQKIKEYEEQFEEE